LAWSGSQKTSLQTAKTGRSRTTTLRQPPACDMTMAASPYLPADEGRAMPSVYVLAIIVVFLVIYLFYAVINPQKF
jgi:K+-transporting ATPase KdpF subunit